MSDTFVCESCQETIPDTDRSECTHWRTCKGCERERFCLQCQREDEWWDSVDRAWDSKRDEAS